MSLPIHPFDPARYPRTYRPSLVFRIAVGLFAGLVFLAGTLGLVQAIRETNHAAVSHAPLGAALITLAMAVLAVSALRYRVVLAPTFIERRILRTRRILRSDISGVSRRLGQLQGPVTYRFRVHARQLPVGIACIFAEDADFKAWFAGL
jgi:hypothetical protein